MKRVGIAKGEDMKTRSYVYSRLDLDCFNLKIAESYLNKRGRDYNTNWVMMPCSRSYVLGKFSRTFRASWATDVVEIRATMCGTEGRAIMSEGIRRAGATVAAAN